MIHRAGAGPEPIPQKQLNVESLKAAIEFAISPSAKAAAQRMAQQIQSEIAIRPSFSKRAELDKLFPLEMYSE
jgi:sterol 3beta-glucosyltransferase